ncbi:DEAD/DEAH box helicase family protein [Bacillaceae bacterium S4-13-56]
MAVDFDKKDWMQDIQSFIKTCQRLDIHAAVERSRSGDGAHVWIFFEKELSASLARKLGFVLLSKTLETRYQLGMESYDRLFPNQDTLPRGGFGNLIALPLQRVPRDKGNSVFIDENFNPYPNQWEFLSTIKRSNEKQINKIVASFFKDENIRESSPAFSEQPLPSEINIINKNGILISKEGLPSSIISKIIKVGTFSNPEFYKAQSKRLSTHNIPRMINCVEEQGTHLILPRGCKEELNQLLEDLSITQKEKDERVVGSNIPLNLKIQLKPEQEKAVEELSRHNNGVLSAATGFGKTVVAAGLMERRQISTLIIVHRKQLIQQWKERLIAYFDLDPSEIGIIGGGKNKPNGKIDIATIQSLNHGGKVKELNNYGQIIVDECHHISAFIFEKVLKSFYIHGLTATPIRKDGLHPIIFMQCGPIRHKVDAKSQSKVRPFEHVLEPKHTSFKSKLSPDEKNIQNLYSELVNDTNRNNVIFNDVLDNGRSPLVLTERIEHVNILYSMFKGFAKNIIILTGGMKKKEEEEKLKKLNEIPDHEERLIIATGKYIGEGFDNSKLDTLFLVMPVSWKGVLQQYVGRLHRINDNKTKVTVVDYVDHKEPMFKSMYDKRVIGYKNMGYHTNESNKVSAEQMKLF